jgi:hypothetical protein
MYIYTHKQQSSSIFDTIMASTVNGENGGTNQLLQLLQYRNQNPDQSLWALSRRYGYSSTAAETSKDDLIVYIVHSLDDKISTDQNPLSYFKDTESFERTKGSEKYQELKNQYGTLYATLWKKESSYI